LAKKAETQMHADKKSFTQTQVEPTSAHVKHDGGASAIRVHFYLIGVHLRSTSLRRERRS
jgi:hypothetical protein